MQVDLIIVYTLLILAPFLFAWKRISFGLAALLIMSTLMISGILKPQEGLSGFSNSATVTIASMFVISEGIRRTGGLKYVSDFFSKLGRGSKTKAIFLIISIIALISAFINNTAAVAIFIPVMIGLSKDFEESPSKLLIPLSFASMFGGVCTLIGTSTNILVSSIAKDQGMEAFGMFEFTPLGIILLVAGFVYLFTFGIRMIPGRRSLKDLTGHFRMHKYFTDVVVLPEFDGIDHPLDKANLLRNLDIDILEIFPRGDGESVESDGRIIREGDVMRVRGSAEDIGRLVEREDIAIKPAREWSDLDFIGGEFNLVEVVIAPDSPIETHRVSDVDFGSEYGAVVLAIRSSGKVHRENLGEIRLSGGDSVLLYVQAGRVENLKSDPSFVVVSEVGLEKYNRNKLPLSIGILAMVILTAALGIVPIVVSAVTGSIFLVILGCLSADDAISAINWQVIFLLAGVIPLGLAMEKTGAALKIAEWILAHLQTFGPQVVLSGFFLLAMILTNMISNQATAALLAPIAISSATNLGVNARPFLIAITFAASLSFMTPVGYQTNTLIYGPGNYKFADFIKIGLPLNILFWIIATFMIPIIWPL